MATRAPIRTGGANIYYIPQRPEYQPDQNGEATHPESQGNNKELRKEPEEPMVQVLSNHNLANIRKQNYIGTRKHNSEAVKGAKQEHRIKDSDG